jgi:large subunit ribosomal protein L32
LAGSFRGRESGRLQGSSRGRDLLPQIPTLRRKKRSYTPEPLMAVPKKKTSKARRDKRRAQHGIESPRVNVCPTCHQPKRPHRVCPTCKTYKGREIEPLRTPVP